MNFRSDTLDWLLKASLWISSNESLSDAFDALREAKNKIRDKELKMNETDHLGDEIIHRLLESVVWIASTGRIDNVSSNLLELFGRFKDSDFDLNGNKY